MDGAGVPPLSAVMPSGGTFMHVIFAASGPHQAVSVVCGSGAALRAG